MAIVARFAGECLGCGGRIEVGAQINWRKGEGSRHVACPTAQERSKPLARSVTSGRGGPPRKPAAGPPKPRVRKTHQEGEQIISRRSQDKYDTYDVDDVVRIKGVDGFFTVVSAWKQPPNEDNGDYDWRACAIVRAATPEESSKRAAEIRRADAPKTVAAYVVAALRATDAETFCDDNTRELIPSGAETWTVPEKTDAHASFHRVSIVGESIVGYHGGHYDDYRASARRVPATERLLAAVRALMIGNAEALAVAADMAQEQP